MTRNSEQTVGSINEWNRAMVTGASSGIGRAIAQLLASQGTDLVVVARDRARLEELAQSLDVDTEIVTADLTSPDQLALVASRLEATTRPIDLLVNNAGSGTMGRFSQLSESDLETMVSLNVVAAHRLAHAAAGAMTKRGRGGILNVSSVAGFLPNSESATYGASKAFLTSLSQSIRSDAKAHGVSLKVTALCPGLTRTEFQTRAGLDLSHLPDFLWQDASEVAQAGLSALAANRAVSIPGPINRVAVGAARLAPTPLLDLAGRLIARVR